MAPSVKGGSGSPSAASADVGVEAGDGDGSGVDDGQELAAVLPTLPSASVRQTGSFFSILHKLYAYSKHHFMLMQQQHFVLIDRVLN